MATLTRDVHDYAASSRSFANPRFYALDFVQKPPSVANLNPSLTVNNITETPVLRYNGKDASGSGWPCWGYGETLTLQAGTAPSYNYGSPLLGACDDSVLGNGGGYYTASTSTFGDIGTEDFVLEWVVGSQYTMADGACIVFSKAQSSDGQGWRVYSEFGAFAVGLDVGASGTLPYVAGNIQSYTWNHLLVFADRNESSTDGMVCYINGARYTGGGGGNDISAYSATLANSQVFEIGAQWGTYGVWNYIRVAYVAMWKHSSWFPGGSAGPAEWNRIARDRFHEMCATKALTTSGEPLPTAARSKYAYLDHYDPSDSTVWNLYRVNDDWPRVSVRKEATGGTQRAGYLCEQSATNKIPYSENFSGTGGVNWTRTNCTCSATSVTPPDKRARTTLTLKENSDTAQEHYFKSAAMTTTASVMYVFSVFAKASNRTWIRLKVSDDVDMTYGCYFDLTNGVTGTTEGSPDYYKISSWGNGWYHCWVAKTHDSSTTYYAYLYAAEADNDVTYSGGGQDSVAFWAAQLELGGAPTSPIWTDGSQITRSVDSMYYDMRDVILSDELPYIIRCQVKPQDYDLPSTQSPTYLCAHDGSDANYVKLWSDAGADVAKLTVYSGSSEQAAISGTTDLWDGDLHTLLGQVNTNSAKLYVDDAAEGTEDTGVTVPSGMKQLNVGGGRSAGNECNCPVRQVRVGIGTP